MVSAFDLASATAFDNKSVSFAEVLVPGVRFGPYTFVAPELLRISDNAPALLTSRRVMVIELLACQSPFPGAGTGGKGYICAVPVPPQLTETAQIYPLPPVPPPANGDC